MTPVGITVTRWKPATMSRSIRSGMKAVVLRIASTNHLQPQCQAGYSLCRRYSSSDQGSCGHDELDPYKVLGVDRKASGDEIKAAYRRHALKWHPDRQPPEKRKEAERHFSAAADAYGILSNPERRSQHDVAGRPPRASGGFPRGGFSYGFPGGSLHSQEDAERLFKEAFGGQGIQEIFGQLLGHEAPKGLRAGMDVQVLPSAKVVLGACRECGIDNTYDILRTQALGKRGRILRVDPSDQTVKIHVEGIGDVWFSAQAVRRLNLGVVSTPFGSFGGAGRVIQTKQQMVTMPDGRLFLRLTHLIQQADGSMHQETVETPIN